MWYRYQFLSNYYQKGWYNNSRYQYINRTGKRDTFRRDFSKFIYYDEHLHFARLYKYKNLMCNTLKCYVSFIKSRAIWFVHLFTINSSKTHPHSTIVVDCWNCRLRNSTKNSVRYPEKTSKKKKYGELKKANVNNSDNVYFDNDFYGHN